MQVVDRHSHREVDNRARQPTGWEAGKLPAYCLPSSLAVNFAKTSQLWQSVDTYHQESWRSSELSSFNLQSAARRCLAKRRARGGAKPAARAEWLGSGLVCFLKGLSRE